MSGTNALVAAGPAWLFCPADRPDRFAKALERADVVLLDLEDAVAPDAKAAARAAIAGSGIDLSRAVIRVNPAGTPDHALDLELLDRLGPVPVMLAKAETAESVAALAPRPVVVLAETPWGVERISEILDAPNAAGAAWGADDLVAGLGGTGSRSADGRYRDVARFARSRTLVAAKARGLPALDAVHLDIADLDGLRAEAEDAAASGFDGSMAVHPSHVPVIRDAFTPAPERLAWARGLLAAAEGNAGVFTYAGQMVDAPLFRQAERLVARAPR